MIGPGYARMMARYNAWQNANLYGAAESLSDGERKRDRGAFFGSIHATLCHILWGDTIWLHRLAGTPKPPVGIDASASYIDDWGALKDRRRDMDLAIRDWTAGVSAADLAREVAWTPGSTGVERRDSLGLMAMQMFNHQTHHRGQAHALITAAGAKPGPTDLPFTPEDWPGR